MDIHPSENKEFEHALVFYGEEIEAVSAAYREHVYYQSLRANSRSVAEYELSIAGKWDETTDKSRAILVNDPEKNVVTILEEFYERTDEAVTNIPSETSEPAFLNTDIPYRCRLGQIALRLVEEIRENITVSDLRIALEEGPDAIIREAET